MEHSSGSAFVAREQQLRDLDAALDRAARGSPAVVLLAGDAGVGKTRLSQEFARRAADAGWLVVTGHCLDLGGADLPYLPFAEVVSGLRAVPELAPLLESRPALADLWGGADRFARTEVDRLQLFDAVEGLLTDLARDHAPTLLLIEDLHWSDASTRDVLRFLVARARDQRLVVVATYRTDDLHRRHPLRPLLAELLRHPRVERIDVPPFTPAELRAFVLALAGDDVDEAGTRDVLARSAGNAYFAEELLLARDLTGAMPESLPDNLADVLLARVERLTPDAQQLVRTASVAGRPVPESLLAAIGELAPDRLQDALRDAVAQHVLRPDDDGSYAFRHALLAEAVYGDLLPGERMRLHRAYAQAVSAGAGAAAELAHHALAANDLPGALSASVAAADEADRRLAPAEAQRHLETALELWPAVPDAVERVGDVVTLGLRASVAASRAGELDRALALGQAAVREAVGMADPALEAKARHRLGKHLLAADQPHARDQTARALELLLGVPALPPPEGLRPRPDLVRVAATHARTCLDDGLDEAAQAWGRWALAGTRELDLPQVESSVLTTLAVLESARPEVVDDLLRQARSRAVEAGELGVELRSTYSLAANWFYAGDAARALAELVPGRERADATGSTWSAYALELRVLEVLARYQAGDWDGSAAAAALVRGQQPDFATLRLSAAALYLDVGRGEPDALMTAERLRPAWGKDGQIALVGGGCMADALSWQGRPQEAVVVAQAALAHLRATWSEFFLGGIWLAALALAAVADLPGSDPGRADELLAVAVQTAERGRPRHATLGPEGRAWLARAHAEHARAHGRHEPGVWQEAAEAFAFGYPYEQARCRWRLAETLLAVGEREPAAVAARQALATARELGAAPLVAAVEALAQRGRLAVGGPVRGGPGPFTPRETEVLALVAEGLTNRQVGGRLFISEKTVSVHLSSVMAKLGATSRTEAVAIAGRRGLLRA